MARRRAAVCLHLDDHRAHTASDQRRSQQRRAAVSGIDGQPARAHRSDSARAPLTSPTAGRNIHHMMSSSSDELIGEGVDAGDRHRESAGGPRQARRAGRRLGADRPRHHHRSARPVRLRQDHPDALHRRHADRRGGNRHGAGPGRRAPPSCAPGRLRDAGPHHLRRPARHRQRALLRRAVRHGCQGRRRRRSPRSASTITEPRCAATFPAASARGSRWRARWWRSPTCWCSTNPPSAWIRCCGSTCGSSSTNSPGAEQLCSSPVTSWTRPTTAATCCSCATVACSPTPHHEATRGHGMSVTGGSVSVRHPAQHRSRSRLSPQALPRHHRRGSCANSSPTTAVSR